MQMGKEDEDDDDEDDDGGPPPAVGAEAAFGVNDDRPLLSGFNLGSIGLDGLKIFCRLGISNVVTALAMENCNLQKEHVKILTERENGWQTLRFLNVSRNPDLDSAAADILRDFLRRSSVQTFVAIHCNFGTVATNELKALRSIKGDFSFIDTVGALRGPFRGCGLRWFFFLC